MNKSNHLLLTSLLSTILSFSLNAQAVKESDLPANEKAQVSAARSAAWKADPTLKQQGIDAKQARRDAMIKVDPSLAPILDKVMPLSGPAAVKTSELSAEDSAKYKAAYKAADVADPTIKPKEKAAKQALRDGMIKADPAVEPILDKLSPPAKAE